MEKLPAMVALLLLGPSFCYAQKMQVNYGLADSQRTPSIAVRALQENFDYVVAFTHEGYWESNQIYYAIIAVKKGVYSKGIIRLKRDNKGKWSVPSVKIKKVIADSAKAIVNYLDASGLWQLNADSLNNQTAKMPDGKTQELTLYDGTNYRFELIKPQSVLMVNAYDPEYFAEMIPEYLGRKKFVRLKDWFWNAYKRLK